MPVKRIDVPHLRQHGGIFFRRELMVDDERASSDIVWSDAGLENGLFGRHDAGSRIQKREEKAESDVGHTAILRSCQVWVICPTWNCRVVPAFMVVQR
jgi:hypothetical protein